MSFFFSDFKKFFVVLFVLLIIFLSIFFFAFLALIIFPIILTFFMIRKFLNSKNNYNIYKNRDFFNNDENQNFIDADYKKKDEKDI